MNGVFRVFIVLVIVIGLLSAVSAGIGALISPFAGTLFFAAVWVVLASVAIWDGAMRLAGRRGLLGGRTRLAQLTAVLQVILGVGVLLSVLLGLSSNQPPTSAGLP